ncbi:hypothetical protein [Rhizobium sp. RU36D]|uniref:hypothetical protein n=1 Tax=Rhizobium sp. RU36D TaxID=1907415 RepID=UPI0009D8107E|nr:hypothetical protein [Rhizobium sp. RU36D]SMD17133.1 hypothetical protein SAMN05880593_13160 [Rhizobium sp. RU36D]
MTVVIAMVLGLVSGLSRSAATIAVVALLLAVVFLVATMVSAGPTSLIAFLVAVGGYNLGLVNLLLLALAINRIRAI